MVADVGSVMTRRAGAHDRRAVGVETSNRVYLEGARVEDLLATSHRLACEYASRVTPQTFPCGEESKNFGIETGAQRVIDAEEEGQARNCLRTASCAVRVQHARGLILDLRREEPKLEVYDLFKL